MKRILVIAVLLTASMRGPAAADVKPNPLFSDNAVLQRGVMMPVWGTADSGERVTVSIQDQNASTVARDGKWIVRLKPLKEGGPFTMTVSGKNKIEMKNVLVGEVWLASGQSNMVWWVKESENPQEAVAASADPMLRHTEVPRLCAAKPATETPIVWNEASPATTGDFSAVGYYFARHLREKLHCPVGIINASWGGTRIEAWMSPRSLDPFGDTVDRTPVNPKKPDNPNKASVLYHGMISPLLPCPIKGAIWYQGESNAREAYKYHDLFASMIRDWRKAWGQGDFPFLFVQLAPYGEIFPDPRGSNWAEVREAQLKTTKSVANTAVAVITDCGDSKNIHPKRKQPVGERLALAARALAYGESIPYKGPYCKAMTVVGNRAVLQFDNTDGGLVAKDGDLTGFAVAGEDRKFYNARGTVVGSRVIVSSDQVASPVAVRYGWADCPVVNLFNGAGIPASPFRTDDFPMVSEQQAQQNK